MRNGVRVCLFFIAALVVAPASAKTDYSLGIVHGWRYELFEKAGIGWTRVDFTRSGIEREPGVFDWSYYRENCRRLREAGLGYTFACWVHFPPKWYLESDRMVPYRNLFSGETIPQISLWSPDWPHLWEQWYRAPRFIISTR